MAPKPAQTDDTEALIEQFRAMPFDQQVATMHQLQTILEEGVAHRRQELTSQLAELDKLAGIPTGSAPSKAGGREGYPRLKVPAKYRSRRNPDLTWTGRGNEPRWLVSEMEETGEEREAFLIEGSR